MSRGNAKESFVSVHSLIISEKVLLSMLTTLHPGSARTSKWITNPIKGNRE